MGTRSNRRRLRKLAYGGGPGGTKTASRRFPIPIPVVAEIIEIEVFAVKAGRDVPGLLGLLDLVVERAHHIALDGLTAFGVDGVGNVRVELEAPVAAHAVAIALLVAQVPVFVQLGAAVVAEAGTEVVLVAAAWAVVGKLTRGHRQEEPVVAFDEFDVTDDEGVVERESAERLERSEARRGGE